MPENNQDDTVIAIAEAAEASSDIRDALLRIAEASEALLSSGLTEDALVNLLRTKCGGVRMGHIRSVLRALPRLAEYIE